MERILDKLEIVMNRNRIGQLKLLRGLLTPDRVQRAAHRPQKRWPVPQVSRSAQILRLEKLV
jgi:hypothetical protein